MFQSKFIFMFSPHLERNKQYNPIRHNFSYSGYATRKYFIRSTKFKSSNFLASVPTMCSKCCAFSKKDDVSVVFTVFFFSF